MNWPAIFFYFMGLLPVFVLIQTQHDMRRMEGVQMFVVFVVLAFWPAYILYCAAATMHKEWKFYRDLQDMQRNKTKERNHG